MENVEYRNISQKRRIKKGTQLRSFFYENSLYKINLILVFLILDQDKFYPDVLALVCLLQK